MREGVLNGSLVAFKLPDVLTFLSASKKTGTLRLTSGDRTSRVLFSGGSVIFAASDQQKLRLGAILLSKKRITKEQHARIEALMRSAQGRFGELAIEEGLFNEERLHDFLKVQSSEVIYDAFIWHDGEFEFYEELEMPEYAVTISIDLANLIMEGARRIAQWEEADRLLPDDAVIFRVVSAPKDDKITLTADEWQVLFLVNGQRTLNELVRDSEQDALEVYRIVYGLQANKLIEPFSPTPSLNDTNRVTGSGATPVVQDDTVREAEEEETPWAAADATVREAPVPDADDTSLLITDQRRLSYSEVVRPVVAQLTIADGVSGGTVIPLTADEYTIGRLRENTIHLSDLGVSGHHARIFRAIDGYVIEDMKSRNGTWVNGTRVFHATLQNGDILRLGATDLKYEVLYDSGPRY
jgi:hypothetical protein